MVSRHLPVEALLRQVEGPETGPVMRMEHKAGDKLSIVDPASGEVSEIDVSRAILGASQLTYVEAVMTQQKEDFTNACKAALHYCGGVAQATQPDNLKSAVTKGSKYEPTLKETFLDFAQHYGTTILPACSYRPRDKALVEGAVKIVYSRVYTKVRTAVYHSLEELNTAIKAALEEHNHAPLKGRNYSRRQQFAEVEKAALMPLRYELKKWLYAAVAKNGHVGLSVEGHYYSVPCRYIGKKVKLVYSRHSVEICSGYERTQPCTGAPKAPTRTLPTKSTWPPPTVPGPSGRRSALPPGPRTSTRTSGSIS